MARVLSISQRITDCITVADWLAKRTGDKNGACEDWIKSSELGCVQANMLLPLCEEYIKEKNDSLKRQNERNDEE